VLRKRKNNNHYENENEKCSSEDIGVDLNRNFATYFGKIDKSEDYAYD
jgi:hypothetical protein